MKEDCGYAHQQTWGISLTFVWTEQQNQGFDNGKLRTKDNEQIIRRFQFLVPQKWIVQWCRCPNLRVCLTVYPWFVTVFQCQCKTFGVKRLNRGAERNFVPRCGQVPKAVAVCCPWRHPWDGREWGHRQPYVEPGNTKSSCDRDMVFRPIGIKHDYGINLRQSCFAVNNFDAKNRNQRTSVVT